MTVLVSYVLNTKACMFWLIWIISKVYDARTSVLLTWYTVMQQLWFSAFWGRTNSQIILGPLEGGSWVEEPWNWLSFREHYTCKTIQGVWASGLWEFEKSSMKKEDPSVTYLILRLFEARRSTIFRFLGCSLLRA